MEKINKFLGRSKTFNSYDKKRRQADNNKQSNDTVPDGFDTSQNLVIPPQFHLAKVSNPSDPQGTLKRFEKENLQRPKIKQITGLGKKAHRNSFSSEDITIRQPATSPKPPRQQRTKTMFDFFTRSKKSPLPAKKSIPQPETTNNPNRRTRLEVDTIPSGSTLLAVPRKDSANMVPLRRKPAELSSIEIDISDAGVKSFGRMKQLQYMRTYSRSMNDVFKEIDKRAIGSVKVLKGRYEGVPIMGRTSLLEKAPLINIQTSPTSPTSKRRSSLPTDFKDLPTISKNKRDKIMDSHQQAISQGKLSNSSNTTKNSQADLVPKSPIAKYFGDSSSNEANQAPPKISTNRKTIKHILQKFLSRRPTQQDLVTKGIIQEQRVFGSSLRKLCAGAAERVPRIPEFVSELVRMIEHERNVISHGIYRASGNVATIQKIRVRINEGGKNLQDILQEHWKDVDVLTGSLKLFFRELAEPLISTEMFTELCSLKDKDLTDSDRLFAEVDEIVQRQPDYHRDVLEFLVKHILYVVSFGDKNSMSIESMAIVWGPSLIFTDNEQDGGMLLQRMTNNNSIVKFLLNVYNENFRADKYITQRSYSGSTLSLVSTSRPSFKQQYSVDCSCSIEDIELLIRSIEKSECAKRINIYVNSKMKKSKKIIERIKAKKSIEKYFTTNDGLCGIVCVLKSFVEQAKVVPVDVINDYDGSTLQPKDIKATLELLPDINRRILELLLNHLNLMIDINSNKYSTQLLVEAWTKHLFVNAEQSPNAGKYLEQLLGYYRRSTEDKREQTTLRSQMLSDLSLNENFKLRGRISGSDTSLEGEVLTSRCSANLSGDVEIRKSVKLHEKEEEQKRNNRNS